MNPHAADSDNILDQTRKMERMGFVLSDKGAFLQGFSDQKNAPEDDSVIKSILTGEHQKQATIRDALAEMMNSQPDMRDAGMGM